MRTLSPLALVVALCTIGCGRRHLIEDFGASYRETFLAQHARTGEASEAVTGLDAQEAAVTADNYRATLVPEGEDVEAQPTVIIAPTSREARQPPPPSVPRE